MRNLPASATLDRHEWNGMEHFLSSTSLADGIHRITLQSNEERPTSLDLYVKLNPGTSLTVHFYGAQSYRKANDTPIFKGYRTSENLKTSYVLVHDPALSLTTDIGLGWYEGFRGFAASSFITSAVAHIAEVARAPRTVFWGGSAGGYAALRNVGAIPNAVAFVWNPQTAIPRYRPAPVRKYAEVAYGTSRLADGVARSSGHVIDLTEQPSPNWSDSPVVYLQEADDSHVRDHLEYLLRTTYPETALEVTRRDTMYGLLSPRFYLHQSPWKPGHSAPPQPVIELFLRALVDSDSSLVDIFNGLETQSRTLLHRTFESYRSPLSTDLNAAINPGDETTRVLQWGSVFGRQVVAHAALTTPLLVKRSILGQSLITAFSRRKTPKPKTQLNSRGAQNNEHLRMALADRRASASEIIGNDPTIQVVVMDMLDEIRGTVNAGNGFIVTNHGLIRRADGGKLIAHRFGDDRHRELWRTRLSRVQEAISQSNSRLVVLDVDAHELDRVDWEWMGLSRPHPSEMDKWHTLINDARELLSAAEWIPVCLDGVPLIEAAELAGSRVAEAIQLAATGERKATPQNSRPTVAK